jgi:hypothetical protein
MKARRGRANDPYKNNVACSTYMFWHIWKERGRIIFQNKSATTAVVANLIRSDLELPKYGKGKTKSVGLEVFFLFVIILGNACVHPIPAYLLREI